jgi:hypothetical protein
LSSEPFSSDEDSFESLSSDPLSFSSLRSEPLSLESSDSLTVVSLESLVSELSSDSFAVEELFELFELSSLPLSTCDPVVIPEDVDESSAADGEALLVPEPLVELEFDALAVDPLVVAADPFEASDAVDWSTAAGAMAAG